MKTPEEIKKFREELLDALTTARPENIAWLQGCIFGLDYPSKEEKDG
jgi:hypothetical protein